MVKALENALSEIGGLQRASRPEITEAMLDEVADAVACKQTPPSADEVVDVLAKRPGWTRPLAKTAVDLACELSRIHRTPLSDVDTLGRSRTRLVLLEGGAPRRREQAPELTPELLSMLIFRTHESQLRLADYLGVKQPQVHAWMYGKRPIPPGRRQEIFGVLLSVAGAWLRDQRAKAQLTQPQLAERTGIPQPSISEYERGETFTPDERWAAMELVLAAALERTGPPVAELTGEELGRLIDDAPISQSEFARRLAVTQPVVSSWRHGRKPIPRERWAKARELLTAAEPLPVRDRIADELLPAVLELVAQQPGILRAHVDRQLERFGEASVRRAVDLAIERGDMHAGPSVVQGPSGRRREYAGLYPKWKPAPPKRDRVGELAHAVQDAVRANPGRSRSHVANQLHAEIHAARDAVRRALRLGLVQERLVRHGSEAPERSLSLLVDRGFRQWRPGALRGCLGGILAQGVEDRPARAERAHRGRVRVIGAHDQPLAGRSRSCLLGGTGDRVPGSASSQRGGCRATADRCGPAADRRPRRRCLRRDLSSKCTRGLLRAAVLRHGTARPARDRRALERPVWTDEGRSHLALFRGPAPVNWQPGPSIERAEFRAILNDARLRPSEAAELLGVPRSAISSWLGGNLPVPAGRRAQVRQLPNLAAAREETTPPVSEPLSGPELHEARKARGLTQLALARRIPTTQPTLGRWERSAGGVPVEFREAVCRALARTEEPAVNPWARKLTKARAPPSSGRQTSVGSWALAEERSAHGRPDGRCRQPTVGLLSSGHSSARGQLPWSPAIREQPAPETAGCP